METEVKPCPSTHGSIGWSTGSFIVEDFGIVCGLCNDVFLSGSFTLVQWSAFLKKLPVISRETYDALLATRNRYNQAMRTSKASAL